MNYWTKISLNIAAAFMVAIFASFIPELAPEFFGDTKCQGSRLLPELVHHYYQYEGCQFNPNGAHEATTHWGWRHWLWMLMGLTLFVVQVIRIGSIKNPNA